MNKFVLPRGIKIGHANNEYTGVTCILTDRAVGGVSVRGGAPGTRETDMLHSDKSQGFVDAIVLSGGSAYGLSSSCGVMRYLREKNIGYSVGDKVVPLVAQAILFDLNVSGEYHFPDENMGYRAAQNASDTDIAFGNVGAGKGATVGKILGIDRACKGGIGGATCFFGDVFVSAIVAVNAFGDVYDHIDGKILAGAKLPDGKFLNTVAAMTGKNAFDLSLLMQSGANTTIGCVITNARLDKTQVNKVAEIAHDGLALSVRPVHTDVDGDTMFALSQGDAHCDINVVMALAVEATACAVENSVRV